MDKTLSLYAAVQSRCLLSLTGNRAYADRSQPLKQLSRFVCHRVPSDWHSLYALIHRNGITLPRWLGKLTFLFQERAPLGHSLPQMHYAIQKYNIILSIKVQMEYI